MGAPGVEWIEGEVEGWFGARGGANVVEFVEFVDVAERVERVFHFNGPFAVVGLVGLVKGPEIAGFGEVDGQAECLLDGVFAIQLIPAVFFWQVKVKTWVIGVTPAQFWQIGVDFPGDSG